tara:strand:+ start:274 stop:447 length:174 start_codon:yes stop_codon:yes gene_type:complete
MTKYNKQAVNDAIKKDPRISAKESKLIHGLLKGRVVPVKDRDLLIDPKKPGYIIEKS